MKKLLIIIVAGVFAITSHADELTAEEQALVDRGATMEMYQPNEHSRHFIDYIKAVKHNGKIEKTDRNQYSVLSSAWRMQPPHENKDRAWLSSTIAGPKQSNFFSLRVGTNTMTASSPVATCKRAKTLTRMRRDTTNENTDLCPVMLVDTSRDSTTHSVNSSC
jgi:hypothetical protein